MDNKKYVSTGLRDLDNALGGGFQPGGLYVLGGRPAMGKSALALNIVSNAIEKGIKVTYFSVEMSKDPHPILSDFWKIEISNIADVAMLLYRDEYYNKDTELKNIAEITIAHNNFGPCSHTESAYLPEYLRFANLEKR